MANLNEILKITGNLAKAETMARELVAKDPQFTLDLQLILGARGKIGEANKLINDLARRFPADNRIAFNRGWHWLYDGDLRGGLALLDRGRLVGVFGSPPPTGNKPRWLGGELKEKIILLHS